MSLKQADKEIHGTAKFVSNNQDNGFQAAETSLKLAECFIKFFQPLGLTQQQKKDLALQLFSYALNEKFK